MHKYIFTVKADIRGTIVNSWHEITENDMETRAALFAMSLRAKMNMSLPLLLVKSEIPWDLVLMEKFVRTKTPAELKVFMDECKI